MLLNASKEHSFFTLPNLIHYINHLNVCYKLLKSGFLKRDEVNELNCIIYKDSFTYSKKVFIYILYNYHLILTRILYRPPISIDSS